MDYGAVIVLGGGLRAGRPTAWSRRRLDRALEICKSCGAAVIVSGGWTPYRPPPRDSKGFPLTESEVAARYLAGRGMPENKIFREWASLDTIGNAYFTRVMHTDPAGLRKLLVITSDFHMPRSRAVFGWVFGLGKPKPRYRLRFESVPDIGIAGSVLDSRKEKEKNDIKILRSLEKRIHTMRQLHEWLFTEHLSYRALPSRWRIGRKALGTY